MGKYGNGSRNPRRIYSKGVATIRNEPRSDAPAGILDIEGLGLGKPFQAQQHHPLFITGCKGIDGIAAI